MFKSIRWKFVTIFIMLVLIAIVISGVFIIQFLNDYNLESVKEKLDDLSYEIIMPELLKFNDLEKNKEAIKSLINTQKNLRFNEEIYVVVNGLIQATSSQHVGRLADVILDLDLIADGYMGETTDIVDLTPEIRTMDAVYPIVIQGKTQGLLYLRSNLSDTDKIINQAKKIILQATGLALGITIILGFIIAQSITGPINDVTEKAFKMARGDFDQYVEVMSDDEIGKLAEMFNHLTRKLKLSLNEITREKNKLEAIVNNMADGLIAVTKHREVLHINPTALKLLHDFDAKVTKDYDTMVDVWPQDMQFDTLIDKYPAWSGSQTLVFKAETFRVSLEPFENEKGDKEGFILVFQNITEHERLETMRKEFVANVSHELKTPLTSIKSYTETLLDGYVDDQDTMQAFLGVINSEADRMGRLVRDLLQLSNFDAKRIALDFKAHDWIPFIKATMAKMQVHVNNKAQSLRLICESQSIEGVFDMDRMEQVLINLLSNACKYTPDQGEITVWVTLENQDVHISIKDTGDGIDQSHLAQIFDRFYRVDKARSRDQGGTGLGLAIAKEIVELHEGTITIESAIGKGTQVNLVLPLVVSVDNSGV